MHECEALKEKINIYYRFSKHSNISVLDFEQTVQISDYSFQYLVLIFAIEIFVMIDKFMMESQVLFCSL